MANATVTIEKGQFLFLQGQSSDCFYILKSGRAEALINDDVDEPTQDQVIRNSRQIAVMEKSNLPIGEIGVYEGTIRTASIRALDHCELMQVAGGQKTLSDLVHTNLQASLLIARTLSTRIVDNHKRWHQVRLLTERMAAYIDNFTILYSILSARSSAAVSTKFVARGRELVAQLDPKLPPNLSNVDRNLPDETAPPPQMLPFPDIELAYFLNLLLFQPDPSLAWMIAPTHPHGLNFIIGQLTDILPRNSRALNSEMKKLESTVEALFGGQGLIQAFVQNYAALDDDQRVSILPFLNKLLSISRDLRESALGLWGETFPMQKELSDGIVQLEKTVSGNASAPSSANVLAQPIEQPTAAAPDSNAPAASITVSGTGHLNLSAALASLSLNAEEKEAIDICMGIRPAEPRALYVIYWKLYPRIWQATIEKDIPELTAFLRYGIASPHPVARPAHLNLDRSAGGPILYGDQWLNRIYSAESPPSRNDLGQTIQDALRESKTTQYIPDEPDPQMDIVRWEVDMMMAKASRAFSGGRGEQATLRRTPQEISTFAEKVTSTAKIAEALVKLIQIDFTAFVRDVRVLLEERSEFLPAEILPFVIIMPASGERAISWQEFEGRSKDTPGRITFPIFSESDVFDMVVAATSKYRWDLAKTVAGADWMNPAEGGLTGRYFDYCSFYKKNLALSEDQKQKLDMMYATATMDADKFALEYAMWVNYESQGVQKLNKVARAIFAEFCPFTIDIRKKLVKQPAFAEILRKDSNKRLKRKQELQRRIYKLEKSSIAIGSAFETALSMYEELPE